MTDAVTAGGRPAPRVRLGETTSAFLDLARGLAASLVVLAHTRLVFHLSWPIQELGGYCVVVFFLLSGMLIFTSLLNHLRSGEERFADFLADRIARIFTPLVPVLVLAVLANFFLIDGRWGQRGVNEGVAAFFGNLFLLNDYPLFQAASKFVNVWPYYVRSYNAAEPLWTVAIEFWIYVVAGLFAFLVVARQRINWLTAAVAAGLALPVFVWNLFAGGGSGLSLTWMIGAAFGALWAAMAGREYSRRFFASLLVVGALGVAGKMLDKSNLAYSTQTATFMAMMLFGFAFSVDIKGVSLFVLKKVAHFFSSYSYSLYLVHNIVLVVVFESKIATLVPSYVLAIIAAHLVASVIYFLFERHHKKVSKAIRPALQYLLQRPARKFAETAPGAIAAMEALDENRNTALAGADPGGDDALGAARRPGERLEAGI